MTKLTHPSPLTPTQSQALIRLLAKATKAGFLPSVPDTWCLLDLIEGALPTIKVEPEIETCNGGAQ
jgi:hypothetical protein